MEDEDVWEEIDEDVWEEFGKLNAKYVKQGKQLKACGKLYVTARDEIKKLKHEVWKLEKDVCYWQESCQNISEEAYEEHLEKGGSM